ncbi:hypothetical protein [Nonomuraea maritima]|uniref:hypothetical protein n=1 Tax=Nonomuraea maritima TaxID=683260 RepID=UPI003717483A
MTGYTTVPYTIAYANELVDEPILFEWHEYELRLTYRHPHRSDWVNGILRARSLDLRDRPKARGSERMRKLNVLRQWKCMNHLLCQVCGAPATDPESGRIPWLLVPTVFERTGEESGRTNAPPTCWNCIPKALKECPMLQDQAMLCTVEAALSAGVLADLYRARTPAQPLLWRHNVFVAWDAIAYHPVALAVAQVVELYDMRPVPEKDIARTHPSARVLRPQPAQLVGIPPVGVDQPGAPDNVRPPVTSPPPGISQVGR